jgi:hypothetical protein
MSCGGCRASARPGGLPVVHPPTRDEQRARAVMCHTCAHALRDMAHPVAIGAVECRISGKPISWHIGTPAPSCPRSRHGAIIRWFGIRWFGVPKPLRWFVRARLSGPIPGCGCIYRLKLLWRKLLSPALRAEGPPGVTGTRRQNIAEST